MNKVLFTGTGLIALTAIAAPLAAIEIDFSGRVRFNTAIGDYFSGKNAAGASATTGVVNYYNPAPASAGAAFNPTTKAVTPSRKSGDRARFSNDERFDVKVSAKTWAFDYGGMLRLEDAGIRSDIYIEGEYGRLDFGDLDDPRSGAYDVSVFAAGPLFGDQSVTYGTLETALMFNDSTVGSSRGKPNIVYTSPSYRGFTAKAGTDGDEFEGSIAGEYNDIGLRASADSDSRYAGMATYTFGDYQVAAYGGVDDDKDRYYGGTAAVNLGALSVSGSVVRARGTSNTRVVEQDLVAGVGYRVAPGLTASASVKSERNDILGTRTWGQARLQLSF